MKIFSNNLSSTLLNNSKKSRFISDDLKNISRFFYSFTAFSLLTVIWHNSIWSTPVLWALGCFTIGSGFGFLFGIPKILQNAKLSNDIVDKTNSDYRQQVNTNLTEISDWLTKIIVGLSLINFEKIGINLDKAASILAQSMNVSEPNKYKAFALALIICFSILGFLFGYLSTRLFLQGAFSRADQEASSAIQAQVKSIETRQDLLSISGKEELPQYGANVKESNDVLSSSGIIEEDPLVELKLLADQYLSIWSNDKNERLLLKNESAKLMFNYAMKNNISKDKILEMADKSGNQGIILTLANTILTYPAKGDDDRILRVAFRVDRWHIQYRIVQALGQLIDKGYATKNNFDSIGNILDSYEKTGDQSLINLIKGIRSLINPSI
jgi:hypothetical protein